MADDTGAVVTPPTTGETSAPAPSAPATTEPTSPAPGGAATSAAKKYEYGEDRSNWVPPHVQRKYVDEVQRVRAEADVLRRQMAALTGVQPPAAPRNPEFDQIRNQIYEVAPELGRLAKLVDKLEKLGEIEPDEIQAIRESQTQAWLAHGNQVLDAVEAELRSAYGGGEISPKALKQFQGFFVASVANDPELKARYEAGDPRLIKEFIADYKQGLLDPYHRSTTATTAPARAAAARLPRGGGSSAITPGPARTVKPSDGEAYHKAAFDRFSKGG